MKKYILTHDFGTSADKASLFSVDGAMIASHTVRYPTVYGEGNCVEQNPEDWWNAFCENNWYLTSQVDPKKILCVSFDGTAPNCLLVDRDSTPLHNAIIWQDTRAAQEAGILTARFPADLLEGHPGHQLSADRTACKLLWMARHKPELLAKADKVLPSVTAYILLRLTGRAVCDPGVGKTTAFMNVALTDWSDAALETVGVTRALMPELVRRDEVVGSVPKAMAQACALAEGTKLVAGTVDYASTTIGAGILKPGDVFICGGTSASIEGLDSQGRRFGKATVASGGSLNWLKEQLCIQEQKEAERTGADVFDLIQETAARAPVGSHGVLFHPYLAGARSVLDNPHATGGFFGITLNTTHEDLCRSVIEGIGFNLNLILSALRVQGTQVTRLPIVGGLGQGALIRQIFADIMDAEIEVPAHMVQTANIGNAVLGGIALGLYTDESAVRQFIKIESVTTPDPKHVSFYQHRAPVFKAVYDLLEPIYGDL